MRVTIGLSLLFALGIAGVSCASVLGIDDWKDPPLADGGLSTSSSAESAGGSSAGGAPASGGGAPASGGAPSTGGHAMGGAGSNAMASTPATTTTTTGTSTTSTTASAGGAGGQTAAGVGGGPFTATTGTGTTPACQTCLDACRDSTKGCAHDAECLVYLGCLPDIETCCQNGGKKTAGPISQAMLQCVLSTCTNVPNPPCYAPNQSCADCFQDGLETDVDCGGECGPCDAGKKCVHDADCVFTPTERLFCDNGVCSK